MKTITVQGRETSDGPIITYGTLILSESNMRVRAEPKDTKELLWVMGQPIFQGPGKEPLKPTELPRWFDSLPLAYSGTMFWCTPVVKR